MNNLVFISTKKESEALSAVGFEVFIIDEKQQLIKVLKELNHYVKVIAYDSELKDLIKVYQQEKKGVYPIFLELPLESKNIGNKVLDMKERIKKSIGIDLL
ncbi:V-type ATP synthase subunit F [Alteracholeplasma palmae J233]|uniref:V-type ATP synthase subunit F n=1 Tax=Alteracholeplasma palmae (strain ATCC 49389 / J233) TaxID=1318466 RepID=U4KLK1_ALTPJ|nr:V-type ATP synthase subunit F [Alteracholeplasma palmae]CCV64733.1 V-type ATP synthase subunit F [Alteracholeplasma palmae J233]